VSMEISNSVYSVYGDQVGVSVEVNNEVCPYFSCDCCNSVSNYIKIELTLLEFEAGP